MKIKFKKRRIYGNLILGFVWVGIGVLNFFEDDNIRWSNTIYLVLGIVYVGHFLSDLRNQYLTVENGTIRKNILYGFGKKINLNQVNSIEQASGKYTLITKTNKLKINIELIEEKSLIELKKILENLNVPMERTPFFGTIKNQ